MKFAIGGCADTTFADRIIDVRLIPTHRAVVIPRTPRPPFTKIRLYRRAIRRGLLQHRGGVGEERAALSRELVSGEILRSILRLVPNPPRTVVHPADELTQRIGNGLVIRVIARVARPGLLTVLMRVVDAEERSPLAVLCRA